ncbi:MAG: hypothetical protein ACLGHL_03790, partial [Actinomycetota bacterium]
YDRAQFLAAGGVAGTTPGAYVGSVASALNTVEVSGDTETFTGQADTGTETDTEGNTAEVLGERIQRDAGNGDAEGAGADVLGAGLERGDGAEVAAEASERGSGLLPFTGAGVAGFLGAGLGLIGAGAAIVLRRRRA